MNQPSAVDLLQAEIKQKDSEIKRLLSENEELRNQRNQEHSSLIQRWQQQINSSDFNAAGLDEILGELAHYLQVSRANLFSYDDIKNLFLLKASYPTADEEIRKISSFSCEMLPTIFARIKSGETIIIKCAEDFGESAAEQEIYKSLQQLTTVLLPIMYRGSLVAAFGLHNANQPKTWTEDDIKMISLSAPLIYQGYQKYRNKLFEHWLENSERNLARATTLETLENCLYEFSKLIAIDGIDFLTPSLSDKKRLDIACHYPSQAKIKASKYDAILDQHRWVKDRLKNNQAIKIGNIEKTSPEEEQERNILNQLNHQSTLILPLIHNNKINGLLNLYTTDKTHNWSHREVEFALKILPLFYSSYQKIQYQKDYQKSLTTLQRVLETTNVAYSIINHDLSSVHQSPFANTILGYSPTSQAESKWLISQALWGNDDKHTEAQWREAIFQNKNPGTCILKLRKADNEPLWVSCNHSPYNYKDNGDLDTILVGFTDISELVKKQEALMQARNEADSANAAKSEFLAHMSHEIRTPMNAILGMAHLSLDEKLSSKLHKQITHIDQAAKNLLGIINDILDFSKIESGQLELEQTDFDLAELLEQVIQVASFYTQNNKQELILNIDKNTKLQLLGDPLRLRQILTNLLSNAIKFTKEGNIQLKVKPADNGLISFSVIDQGIGMTNEQLKNLFQPFTQADRTISRKYGGTGLGLSIVKRLVELMGGNIVVDSEDNRGSIFSFELRLKESKTPPRKHVELSQLRTLVVDDNKEARDVICNIARQLNLVVSEASSATTAISLVEESDQDSQPDYDLVLMDYRMPEINGLEAAELIKNNKQHKSLPIILMVSTCDRNEAMNNRLSEHVEGFLSKPASPSRLYNSVNHLIYNKHETTPSEDLIDNRLLELHVLLVEDNIVNQKVAQGLLKKQGVFITTVNNGQEAIDTLMRNKSSFDLILMDIEMPVIDGYQATRFIRKNLHLETPIIAMTAHAMDSARNKCLKVGMNTSISKPIDPRLFYQTLLSFLPENTETDNECID